MKQYLPRYGLGLLILLALLGHSARIYQIPFVNHLDSLIYDAKLRLTMPRTLDPRVVILDIDEKSLAEQGRWPWGRDKLALLMDKLFNQYGMRLVGFDVVLVEDVQVERSRPPVRVGVTHRGVGSVGHRAGAGYMAIRRGGVERGGHLLRVGHTVSSGIPISTWRRASSSAHAGA